MLAFFFKICGFFILCVYCLCVLRVSFLAFEYFCIIDFMYVFSVLLVFVLPFAFPPWEKIRRAKIKGKKDRKASLSIVGGVRHGRLSSSALSGIAGHPS